MQLSFNFAFKIRFFVITPMQNFESKFRIFFVHKQVIGFMQPEILKCSVVP